MNSADKGEPSFAHATDHAATCALGECGVSGSPHFEDRGKGIFDVVQSNIPLA